MAAATAKAQEEKADLIIHTRDGRIGRRKTFSNDSQNIKGLRSAQPAVGTGAGRATPDSAVQALGHPARAHWPASRG
ncbi:DUF2188 domain-containing protein [Cupriavidus necator]|uniref:DUF2188 domain-containing protein n=1 Tax=Cupriavidus necator TaxID=106590 RepID=UPI0039C0879D